MVELRSKRRKLQRLLYGSHVALLLGVLIYFAIARSFPPVIAAGLFLYFLYTVIADLSDAQSFIRAPVEELVPTTIRYRDLVLLDWVILAVVAIAFVMQALTLLIYGPSQTITIYWSIGVLILILVLGPLVAIYRILDRSHRSVLGRFVGSGFRFPPPESEFWERVQREQYDVDGIALVAGAFEIFIGLQVLVMSLLFSSLDLLLVLLILATRFLASHLLQRLPDSGSPHAIGRSRP